jgi:5-methylcytosine-specific restriction protein A
MPTTTIVCGPPCSGKNHYIEQHQQPGDTVIDWDAIAVELGSPKQHHHPKAMYGRIAAEYERRLAQLEQQPPTDHDVWIIRGLPEPTERQAYAARLNAEVVTLTPPLEVLLQRARDRGHAVRLTEWSIRRWFERAGKTTFARAEGLDPSPAPATPW